MTADSKAHQVAGENLTFIHADVVWTSPWKQQLTAVKGVAQRNGMKFGVIYDGGGSGKPESDELWTKEALERSQLVESDPSLIRDHAIMQTWARWPKHMLPETDPGTLTNLVFQYANWKRSRGQPLAQH